MSKFWDKDVSKRPEFPPSYVLNATVGHNALTLRGSNTAVLRQLAQSGEQWQSPMTMLMLFRLQWIVGQAEWSHLRSD